MFFLLAIIILVLFYIVFKCIYLIDESNNGNLLDSIKTESTKLRILTEESDYSWGTTSINLLIENQGTMSVEFGSRYSIEKLQNGQWYKIPFKKRVAFNTMLYNLNPNSTYKQKIDLSSLDYGFKVGKFRVVKEISSNGHNIKLATEFNISLF
jgi:hypothetical protein